MKSITLTIIAAAMVSACAITPDQGSTMQFERSPQAVPASSSSEARRTSSTSEVRQEATPNVDLQIYINPDLHLAALELRTIS